MTPPPGIHAAGSAHHPTPDTVDVTALAWELKSRITGEVRFDAGSKAMYATDASNYRQVPIGVVVPRTIHDVVETVAVCREFQVPVLSRGGGTSLAGQTCNAAIVIDFSKYLNAILELDPKRRLARVQPGVVLDDLRRAAWAHDLTFAPDPSTHNHCTLGGMLGNNSCGVHSVLGGKTAENTIALDILLYDGTRLTVGPTSEAQLEAIIAAGGRRGEIYGRLRALRDRVADQVRLRYPRIPRRVSGFNLDELLPENGFDVAKALVGSEGTCVVVLEATVKLIDWPRHRVLAVLGYPDVYEAADHIMEVLAHHPIGLEGVDEVLIRNMQVLQLHNEELKLLPKGRGFLVVEFGADTLELATDKAQALIRSLPLSEDRVRVFVDPEQQEQLWKVREAGLGATAIVPGQKRTWEGWEDSAVPPDRVGAYLRELRSLLERFQYTCSLYGHFGDGCIHTRIEFDLVTRHGIDQYRRFTRQAAELVLRHGGSLSGEHGDGQSRAELLPLMFGPDLITAFEDFKAIWDPQWKLNPGKVVKAARQDEHLKLGTEFRPWHPTTHFSFPDDHGDFATASLRCVGIGECRRADGVTMCPSYQVTKEERHSTRGRSRLLFEMLRGEVITDGWASREVKEGLDLCLSCKGCKNDCPTSVDMATYKAEFLSHYHEHHLRPRSAHAFGRIDRWARIAAKVPRLVNWVAHAPVLGPIAKIAAGMAPQREIPRFATETFVHWFRNRADVPARAGQRVLLWPDTFTNFFHPEIARDAVQVLEHAGCTVVIPGQHLCCGRPLYDYGMLDTAKAYLRKILKLLRTELRAGTPLVVLEPSCLAVFRDELCNLIPHDEDGYRLSQQAFTLAEFLTTRASHWTPPRWAQPAFVHGHCHHKSVVSLDADKELFTSMGTMAAFPDHGCCGMAGSFGFEKDHYQISVDCGERSLLPAVRARPADQVMIADGFSCREQMRQLASATAIHSAQAIRRAIDQQG